MRLLLPLLALAIIGVGCTNTRVPLSAFPDVKRVGITLETPAKSNISFTFLTAIGQNASQDAMGDGLIAMLIASGVGAGDEAAAKKIFEARLRPDLQYESRQMDDAVKAQLQKAGLLVGTVGAWKLQTRIRTIGLREPQRGFWVPYLNVRAELDSGGAKPWQTYASSTGTRLRRLEEFSKNPELYRKDMDELIEDIARQLIEGPIRH